MASFNERLDNIQGLRAIAAYLVLVMHTLNLAVVYGGREHIAAAMSVMRLIGTGGVDMFFVVSGFIIVWVAHRAAGNRVGSAAHFALRRAVRIYPLFWLTLAAMLALPAIPGSNPAISEILANPLSLILVTRPAAHPISWTLVFEIHFYVVATVLIIVAGGRVALALVLWGITHSIFVGANLLHPITNYVFFNPVSLNFVFGVLLGSAMVYRRSCKVTALILASYGAMLVLLEFTFGRGTYDDPLSRVIVWGMPTSFLLLLLLQLESQRGLMFPGSIRKLGDWSYSLYLWHVPVLVAVGTIVRALDRHGTFAGGAGYVIVGITASTLVAAVSFRYFERPIMLLGAKGRHGARRQSPQENAQWDGLTRETGSSKSS
jgi:peptidoglycan/LPS O-acetylase OafA/YrhL